MSMNNPLADTTRRAIPPGAAPHTCTCLFSGGEIAVVNVYGACSQRDARAIVRWLWWPQCRYIVTDGDCTYGHAPALYPHSLVSYHTHESKRNEEKYLCLNHEQAMHFRKESRRTATAATPT